MPNELFKWKPVSVDRRKEVTTPRSPSKYQQIWEALEKGGTLELTATADEIHRLKSAWKAREIDGTTKRRLVVGRDDKGEVYVAWLEAIPTSPSRSGNGNIRSVAENVGSAARGVTTSGRSGT